MVHTKEQKKAVVTGGAGFIGSNLVDVLVREGYTVEVIDDLSAGDRENVNPRAGFHKGSIVDTAFVKDVCRGASYIFHCAALPRVQFSLEHPIEAHKVNIDGTLSVLEAARAADAERVIFSSSSAVYGDKVEMPLTEDMEVDPKSPYGLHKYIGERYCTSWSSVFGMPTVSLRYFNVYGPRQSAEGAYALVIAKFLKQKQRGEPMTITGDGSQTRDFIHVRDVVDANLRAATSQNVGSGEVVNIGHGSSVSVNRIAELVGGETVHIEPRFEPQDTLADARRAYRLLGWRSSISIEEGIEGLKTQHGLS